MGLGFEGDDGELGSDRKGLRRRWSNRALTQLREAIAADS
jgi:hypothetical protein